MSEVMTATHSISRKPGAFEKRIHEIDFVRGFLISLVLMDHLFCWLWQYNEGWAYSAMQAGRPYEFYKAMGDAFRFYWYSNARDIVRFIALFGFCFVSGISTAFSRNNWIRAAQMIAFAFALAIGSNILDAFLREPLGLDSMRIDFNIIAVLAWSTLFYCFIQNRSWKGLVAMLLGTLLIAWYFVPWLAEVNYEKNLNIYAPPFIEPDAPQADWMPLFPFMCFFLMGALLSYFVYAPTRQSLIKHRGNWERPLCFMGRHSLLFYVCHQMILIPFFLLLDVFLG